MRFGRKTVLCGALIAAVLFAGTSRRCGAEYREEKNIRNAGVLKVLRLLKDKEVESAFLGRDGAQRLARLCSDKERCARAVLALMLSAWAGNEDAKKTYAEMVLSGRKEQGLLAVIGASFLPVREAVPLLIKRLKDSPENSAMRGVAGVVLAKITATDIPCDPVAWQRWWEINEKSHRPLPRINWKQMAYELEHNPLTGDWRFDVGVQDEFFGMLRKASIVLRRFDCSPCRVEVALDWLAKSRWDRCRVKSAAVIRDRSADLYANYLSAISCWQLGMNDSAANAFSTVVGINPASTWASVLVEYAGDLKSAGRIPADKRIEMLFGMIDKKLKADEDVFKSDVAARLIRERMLDVDADEVACLARDTNDEKILAGCLLLLEPRQAMRMAIISRKDAVEKSDLARYAYLQVLNGLVTNTGETLAQMQMGEVFRAMKKSDARNGLYGVTEVGARLLGSHNAFDQNGRPAPLKPVEIVRLEKALALKRFDARETEMLQAVVAALKELRHPAPHTVALATIRRTAAWSVGFDEIAHRLRTNIIDAVIAGDAEAETRAAAVLEKLAEKIASQRNSIDNMLMASNTCDGTFNGRAEGLRVLGKTDEARSEIKKRNDKHAESGIAALLSARLSARPLPPVPALAEMISEAVLEDEIAFHKKYSIPEEND